MPTREVVGITSDGHVAYARAELWAPTYDPERVWTLISTWQELRSYYERLGLVDEPEWHEVLDVERALRAMGSPGLGRLRSERALREHQAAAAVIGLKMLLGWDDYTIRGILRRGPGMEPSRLVRKGCHWSAAYLSGGSWDDADRAFQAAS